MNVAIRVDASVQVGSGHMMRCLTLAEGLRRNGWHVVFLSIEWQGHMSNIIEAREFESVLLSIQENWSWAKDADAVCNWIGTLPYRLDWLIVDHYSLDKRWESRLRPFIGKIMVIDDLADRWHECDLLLDQNYYKNMNQRYGGLIPPQCIQLLGPSYLLLREEFNQFHIRKIRDGTIHRILVFYGGVDATGETSKVLEAWIGMSEWHDKVEMHVIVGSANPYQFVIERQCKQLKNVHFHVQVDNMAHHIAQADLALGAGGVTMWERCYLGLPSIVTIVADNQRQSTEETSETGAVWNLGWHGDVKADKIADILGKALTEPNQIHELSRRALQFFQDVSSSGTEQVIRALMEASNT